MNGKEKLRQHLDKAYLWLGQIPVTGEAVDHMAMARQELRSAFQLVKEPEQDKEAHDG